MEDVRSEEEITAKIIELEKELDCRYTASTKELIRTKIDTLKCVLKITERF